MSVRVLVLVYVNNILFYRPHKEWIDETIKRIEEQDLKLEFEDSAAGLQGIHIERNEMDGTMKLT